jgi:hypothetical protein
MAVRIGFHANFFKRNNTVKNASVVQIINPKPGVTNPMLFIF